MDDSTTTKVTTNVHQLQLFDDDVKLIECHILENISQSIRTSCPIRHSRCSQCSNMFLCSSFIYNDSCQYQNELRHKCDYRISNNDYRCNKHCRLVNRSTSQAIYIILLSICLLTIQFNGALALKIIHYSIPRMVDATNSTPVTLDCVYNYDPGDVKLVVRWFHNDSPEPIYQWIPEPDIRYVGELIRPYFDMEYKVSGDRYSKYRALRLSHKLPVSLSGNFSCVISSIANQDTRQGQMVVFVPPQKFEFQLIELSADQLALDCTVDGVHPKPVITFSEQISSNHSFRHHFPVVNVTVSYRPDVSLYRASFRHPVRSVLSVGTIYECRLELPGTNYVRKKRIKIIFPTNYNNVDKPMFPISISGGMSGKTAVTTILVLIMLVIHSIHLYSSIIY